MLEKAISHIKLLMKYLNLLLFDGYSAKSYSQEGEDMILRAIFQDRRRGFYVDIGAHHPVRFSNTYYFYRRGWSGINIDATPGSMELFYLVRPRDINIEVAIAQDVKEMTFFMFNESALNSFDVDLSIERNDGHFHIIKREKIITETLSKVLFDHLPTHQRIDFMSIDVEGLDFEVLQSNDWDAFRPTYILSESLNLDMTSIESDKIYAFLVEKGYGFFAKTTRTIIFRDMRIASTHMI